jgi:PKD repeat protein
MRTHLCTLIVICAALVAASPAAAEVYVEGSGEPAFTNSTNNTQWVRWQAPSGTDAYRLHARYYRDNVQVYETTWQVPASGTAWIDWNGVAALQEGSTYAICVAGEMSFPNDSLFFPEGGNSCVNGANEGKRTYTTIDRTKPTTSIVAAAGADFTKDQAIPLSIGFQDASAGPFPATFLCVKAGTGPCENGFVHSPECSVPGSGGKSTTFTCSADASQLPDGPVTVCAVGADAAVPNNPSSANQTGNASQANRSDAQCDTVVLDRQGPTLTVNASKTVVRVGESVAFSREASDSGAGLDSGTSLWEFGDGTPSMASDSVSHAFGQPGTYVVKFRAKDRAGNESVAQREITVEAPPTGSTSTPGDGTSTPGDTTPEKPVAGGGPLAGVKIGSVTVVVPKRARLGKAKQLVLNTRTDQAGALTLRLVRGKKVYSRVSARLAPGDSKHRLRLPRGLKPGTYTVKIAFKPAGAGWSASGAAKIVLKKAAGR